MPKYNVLIDTSVYRKNPSRSGLSFHALARLCHASIVKLHLPYIVEREFQTQQCAIYGKDFHAATSSIEALTRRGVSAAHAARLKAVEVELKALSEAVIGEAETTLGVWADSIGAQRHPITHDLASNAMENYFLGNGPVREPKHRADIPDAFIFQTILSLAKEATPLVVVCDDGRLATATAELKGVSLYRALADLIESKEIQKEILDLDVIDNLAAISKVVEASENETHNLENELKRTGGPKLMWQKIHSNSIPDDNNEATITSYGDPENVEFFFDQLSYFGEGTFGLPFSFTAIVYATYYIFKSDYWALPEEKQVGISDHNDHYFEAEEEFEVCVNGMLKLSMPQDRAHTLSVENFEDVVAAEIDSFDQVTLTKDEI